MAYHSEPIRSSPVHTAGPLNGMSSVWDGVGAATESAYARSMFASKVEEAT